MISASPPSTASPCRSARYKGKAVLVVNTASECGYTPQYKDLQALWQRYRDRGLVVLGVPSNDFGGQEPGTEAEIKRFCERQYAVDFPLTAKEHGHRAKRRIRSTMGGAGRRRGFAAPRWNFHKYLIGPDGELAAWFPTKTSPVDREGDRRDRGGAALDDALVAIGLLRRLAPRHQVERLDAAPRRRWRSRCSPSGCGSAGPRRSAPCRSAAGTRGTAS